MASIILSDGPWGAECYRIVRADGTLVEGAWQSLFPLFTLDGMGYYGFMAFEATPVYVEELDEEQYDWDPDGVRYGVVDENGRNGARAPATKRSPLPAKNACWCARATRRG